MKPLPSQGTSRLEWVQPKALEDYFELMAGDDLVASLAWQSIVGNLAQATTAQGTWTLEQLGIINQRVEARQSGTGEAVAIYYPGLMGSGVLQWVDGRKLKWETTNFWGSDWAFFGEGGRRPLALREGVEKARWRDMLKTQFSVQVDPDGESPAELALLAALGLFLIIVWRRQAAAGAVAATAAVAG